MMLKFWSVCNGMHLLDASKLAEDYLVKYGQTSYLEF